MRYTISLLLASLVALPARAEVPDVVTDFGPVQSLVQQVMGTLGTPTMLLPANSDPHEFQMRPSQARALQQADLVFWIGPELMPSLASAITTLTDPAKAVALLHDAGGHTRMMEGTAIDPHAWLDPTNAMAWVGTIANRLTTADPENAATYAANAATTRAALQALDAGVAAQLQPVQGKPFVVFHDALGYFADHYGLTVAGAIELGDATTPSAGRLAELRAAVASSGAVCVFPEAGRDPALVAVIVEGTAARVGPPQDVEGITQTADPDLYARLVRGIATSLVTCLDAP
jgi:zinc transport system substrate-binding protein